MIRSHQGPLLGHPRGFSRKGKSGRAAPCAYASRARRTNKSSDGRYGEGFQMPACGALSARAERRRPKASQEGTRGGRATCRLWGFDDTTACVVDALVGVIGGGSTVKLR